MSFWLNAFCLDIESSKTGISCFFWTVIVRFSLLLSVTTTLTTTIDCMVVSRRSDASIFPITMNPTRLFRKLLSIRIVACSLAALLTASVGYSQDARGKQLYVNCLACHGAEGHGNKLLNAPAISGLSEKYVAAQIEKFKLGHRGGDVRDATGMQMRPMSMTMATDEDVAAVSSYVASLAPASPAATLEGGDAEKGKMFYATCQACHGAGGSGNDMLSAPSLAGQYDWYLQTQLHNFKQGIRGSKPEDVTGGQMRPMAMMLADDQAVLDVIAYIQTLSK